MDKLLSVLNYSLIDSLIKKDSLVSTYCLPLTIHFDTKEEIIESDTDVTDRNVFDLLQDIYVNGIGFHDTAGIIAIPVIIALFAFSFPFIFDRINQINNKYQSKYLADLFCTSLTYQLFWYTSIISILYILFYGFMSLVCKKVILIDYSKTFNLLSVCIAAFYAVIVWFFARSTIQYNTPTKLICIIQKRYQNGIKRAKFDNFRLMIYYYKRFFFKRKDNVGNAVYKSACKMSINFYKHAVEHLKDTRLLELSKYAIRNDDFELFCSIMDCLEDKIIQNRREEKNSFDIRESENHDRFYRFFIELMKYYSPFKNAYMENETIIFKMVGIIDRSKYIGYSDILSLAICMCRMIDNGNLSLLTKYIEYTSYYFKYLPQLPKIHFVGGGKIEDRPFVEKKSHTNWINLCVYHFIALAYVFEKKKYTLFDNLLTIKTYNSYNLYPRSGADTLIIYSYCSKKSYISEAVFNDNYDLQLLLSQYTAFILMLMFKRGNDNDSISEIIPSDLKTTLNEKRESLIKAAEQVKQDKELLKLYPQLLQVDFGLCFEYYYTILFSNDIPHSHQKLSINKKSQWICKTIMALFRGSRNVNTTISKENSESSSCLHSIENVKKDDFERRFGNIEEIIRRNLNYDIFQKSRNSSASIGIGPCQLLVNKNIFTEHVCNGVNLLFQEYAELIVNRVLYAFLSSFREMELEEKETTSPNFDILFNIFSNGQRNDYVMISVDSAFHSILDIRYKEEKRYYQGAIPFFHIDSVGFFDKLSHLDNYKYFKGSLLIVPKTSLPNLVDIGNEAETKFTYQEVPEIEKKRMRVTVDINKKMVFNKNSKIAVVRLIPLKL